MLQYPTCKATNEVSIHDETVITKNIASTSFLPNSVAPTSNDKLAPAIPEINTKNRRSPKNTSDSSTGIGVSYIPSNVNLGQKKHTAALPLNINNVSPNTILANKSSSPPTPCTFFLLDCLEGAGGFSPDKIFREDIAKIVKSLPKYLFFFVWYRGCFVDVKALGQHFQCIRGSIVGLDIARYIDIVVPRIALACEVAFATSVLGVRATKNKPTNSPFRASNFKSNFDDNNSGSRVRADSFVFSSFASVNDLTVTDTVREEKESIRASSRSRKKIQADISNVWQTKDTVPPLADRPILKIKL